MALPINFHKTFLPERRLIASLLGYAASGQAGDYQEISAGTGIPTGQYTGKVPAILDYARGMGLITVESTGAIKRPLLTGFGRAVFLEDRLLGEPITQWLAHMHLCRPDIGAVAWHHVFGVGRRLLGNSFTAEQLEEYLQRQFGQGNNRTGPLVRTYQDESALAQAKALSTTDERLIRQKAPVLAEFAPAYSAFLLSLVEAFFPGQSQVTITDLNARTQWFDACFWTQDDVQRVLATVEHSGYVAVDRHMQPWIVERKNEADRVWPEIYRELP